MFTANAKIYGLQFLNVSGLLSETFFVCATSFLLRLKRSVADSAHVSRVGACFDFPVKPRMVSFPSAAADCIRVER